MKKTPLALAALVSLAACGGDAAPISQVESSGKTEVALAEVPAEVLAAAEAALPGFTPTEAERETRDGRHYFDIGGTLPGGGEVEFDIMEEGGRWRVVETQRDIAFAEAPAEVRRALAAREGSFAPSRVIESVQADGLIIYEVFGPEGGDPQGRKAEVRWDGSTAEVLTSEWAH